MAPRIFISSTIADFGHLRDMLREAILELKYVPVMSEYAEVGYISPDTAANSCYRSVSSCQMVVMIIGSRYGSVTKDGLSVTHHEYLTARDLGIPVITFVNGRVMHFHDLYKTNTSKEFWSSITEMDNPESTFQFLKDISDSSTYNALIEFTSAIEAKDKLKSQIALFVGDRLGDMISPMSEQIKDVLAEIRTLRAYVVQESQGNVKQHLAATRLLLDDAAAEYRKILEKIFGDLDSAVDQIWNAKTIDEVIQKAGYTFTQVTDEDMVSVFKGKATESMRQFAAQENPARYSLYGTYSMSGGVTLYNDKSLCISHSVYKNYDKLQRSIYSRTKTT